MVYSQAYMFVYVKVSIKANLYQYRKSMIMARLVNQYTCLRVGCFFGFFHLPEKFAYKKWKTQDSLWCSGQIFIGTTAIVVRKTWTYPPSASGSYRRQGGRKEADESQWISRYSQLLTIFYRLNYLEFLFPLIPVQCCYSVTNAFQPAFLK